MNEKTKKLLLEKGITPQWYMLNGYSSCLVIQGGNPKNLEDRIAFINHTPCVNINGTWIVGPKGINGNINDNPEILGAYPPSREWCEQTIINGIKKQKKYVVLLTNKSILELPMYIGIVDAENEKEALKKGMKLLDEVLPDFETTYEELGFPNILVKLVETE